MCVCVCPSVCMYVCVCVCDYSYIAPPGLNTPAEPNTSQLQELHNQIQRERENALNVPGAMNNDTQSDGGLFERSDTKKILKPSQMQKYFDDSNIVTQQETDAFNRAYKRQGRRASDIYS